MFSVVYSLLVVMQQSETGVRFTDRWWMRSIESWLWDGSQVPSSVLERNFSQCHFVHYISYMDYTSWTQDLGGETLVIDLRHSLVVFYIKPSNFSKYFYFCRREYAE